MFGFFKKRKLKKDMKRQLAGATVVHKNPFDNIKAPYQTKKLSQGFIDKWIAPFYMERLLESDTYENEFFKIKNDLNPEIVKKLLGYFDWRSRITGAYFSALMNYSEFEDFIGSHLLKSEVCYSGEGYLTALSLFNTDKSIDYIKRYLDYYLGKPDLWFDQGDAMASLIWLDNKNNTSLIADNNYMDKWTNFISNKPNWNLEHYTDFFNRRMTKIQGIIRK